METFLSNLPESTSLVEILYASKTIVQGILYDTSVHENVFMDALNKLQKYSYGVTEKRFKRYAYMDYEYIVAENKDTTVLKKKLLHHSSIQQLVMTAMQNEISLPYKFPWSNELHDIHYVSRVIFKINGRLNLHMDAQRKLPTSESTDAIYRITFSYNIGRGHTNADFAHVPQQVSTVLRQAGL